MLHVSKRYFSFINKNIKMKDIKMKDVNMKDVKMKYIKMKDIKMKDIKMKKIVDKFFKQNDKNGTIREALKIGQECSKKL